MHIIDWVVVGGFVLFAAALGVIFSKKASQSTTDFFVAGRSLPWWIAGTSLVATTFSTDTPLFVAGLSRNDGISANWFWWSAAIGQIATIFFFAKYWRRTKALTEIEFVAQRYEAGWERDALRVFKVFFDGVLVNCIVMASVTLAATKVIEVVMGLSTDPVFEMNLWGSAAAEIAITPTGVVLMVLAVVALGYSMSAGLYGVAYTDLVQFGLAMLGTIWLAVVSYRSLPDGQTLEEGISGAPGFDEQLVNLFPDLTQMNLLTFSLMILVAMNWWAMAPGSGYFVQRLLATKSEGDSMLAFLWYNFCHYVLRPWPWIIVGLVSMIYFPDLQGSDAEKAFPLMIDKFLGPGIKGVMVAAMLAAYMSTLDTHLNWGASYLVNDVYQPFIKKNASQKHYVRSSRVAMVLLMIAAVVVTTMLTGILDAYKYINVIIGGTGSVLILRWYWWRVNAWSEISAIITAAIVGNACVFLLADPKDAAGIPTEDWFAVRLMITVFATLFVWIIVTFATTEAPTDKARDFYRRIRVSGPGWKRIAQETGVKALPGEFQKSFVGWFAAMGMIFGMLLGIGYALLERWSSFGICAAVTVVSTVVLTVLMRGGVLSGGDVDEDETPETTATPSA